jgi:hypothetical protein
LASGRSQILTLDEIENSDSGRKKSADDKKPEKKIVSLHVGFVLP